MSARVIELSHPRTVSLNEMLPGQIGTFNYGHEKILVLRSYNEIVDLNRPSRTWGLQTSHRVELLPEGSRVEIIAEASKE